MSGNSIPSLWCDVRLPWRTQKKYFGIPEPLAVLYRGPILKGVNRKLSVQNCSLLSRHGEIQIGPRRFNQFLHLGKRMLDIVEDHRI